MSEMTAQQLARQRLAQTPIDVFAVKPKVSNTPEHVKAYQKAYYQAHKDEAKEREAKLRADDPNHKSSALKWYYENRERCLENRRKWSKEHKAERTEYMREWRKKHPGYFSRKNREERSKKNGNGD